MCLKCGDKGLMPTLVFLFLTRGNNIAIYCEVLDACGARTVVSMSITIVQLMCNFSWALS